MNDEKFWLGIWTIVAVVIIVITINAGMYWRSENQNIVDMVLAGASPIEAACAVQDPMGNNPTCVALLAKGD